MESINHATVHQIPWNKGKLVGQKAQVSRHRRRVMLWNFAEQTEV
jgi:hypothetical protein